MPLIKHSQAFLEKQAQRAEAKRLEKEKLIQEASNALKLRAKQKLNTSKEDLREDIFLRYVTSWRDKELSIGQRLEKTLKDVTLGQYEIPHLLTEEYKEIFEMTRFIRRNIQAYSEFRGKNIDPFREIEPMQIQLTYMIKMLQDLEFLGLLEAKKRYSKQKVYFKLKEIDKLRNL